MSGLRTVDLLVRARCRRPGASTPARSPRGARLDARDEAQQRSSVVGLGEALAGHQPASFQLRVGVQEPVGGDQFHPRVVGQAGQQLAQEPRDGGLPDRDRPGDPDDERGARRRLLAAGTSRYASYSRPPPRRAGRAAASAAGRPRAPRRGPPGRRGCATRRARSADRGSGALSPSFAHAPDRGRCTASGTCAET